jgi:hypothetical protein
LRITERSSKEQDPDPWPDRIRITSAAAVDALTNLRVLPILAPFLREEHTLTSAAAAANKPVSTVAYWIRRLARSGVLVETRRVARGGMAMPMYRAAGRELVVPIEYLPIDRRVALLDRGRLRLLRRFLDGIDEAMAADDALGLRFSAADEPAGVEVGLEGGDQIAGNDWADSWGIVRLSPERARALVRDIERLVVEHTRNDDATGRPFIVHLGIAPEPRHRWRSATDP